VMTEREQAEHLAYTYLEIEPSAVAAAPKINHLFKHVPNGEAGVWEILEESENVEARRLLEFRNRLTQKQREAVPFEAIVIAAGMTTKHAFGVVSEAIVEHAQDASRLILHAATPEIMATVVKDAKENGGSAAKMLLQATNLVPRPKNTVIIHNGDNVRGNKNQLAVLPSAEDTGRRLGNRFNLEMAIPAAIAAPAEDSFDDEEREEEGAP